MARRGVKIAIIIGIVVIILIGIAIPVYFYFMNKTVYRVTGVGQTSNFTVAEFVDKSELQFNKNGTFHITIAHKEKGLSFTGIGTYTMKDQTYQLTFLQAFVRDNIGNIVNFNDISDEARDNVKCVRTGSRIRFTDHKNQTFYFG